METKSEKLDEGKGVFNLSIDKVFKVYLILLMLILESHNLQTDKFFFCFLFNVVVFFLIQSNE